MSQVKNKEGENSPPNMQDDDVKVVELLRTKLSKDYAQAEVSHTTLGVFHAQISATVTGANSGNTSANQRKTSYRRRVAQLLEEKVIKKVGQEGGVNIYRVLVTSATGGRQRSKAKGSKAAQKLTQTRQDQKEQQLMLGQDKGGLVIEPGLDDEVWSLMPDDSIPLTVTNTGDKPRTLSASHFKRVPPGKGQSFHIGFQPCINKTMPTIGAGEKVLVGHVVPIGRTSKSSKSDLPARSRAAICVEFQSFSITRFIDWQYVPDTLKDVKSSGKYVKKKRRAFFRDDKAKRVFGKPPPSRNKVKFKVTLKQYLLKDQWDEQTSLDKMAQRLTKNTYIDKFTALVNTEERSKAKALELFDMEAVRPGVKNDNSRIWITVEGLAEGRPSVLVGDEIDCVVTADPSIEYTGYVHEVQQKQVVIDVGTLLVTRLRKNPTATLNVHFKLSRMPDRLRYRALDQVKKSPAILDMLLPDFAKKHAPVLKVAKPSREYKTPNDQPLNEEQLQVVKAIASMRNATPAKRHVPFVLFGPPGTGKTTTLKHAIRAIFDNEPTAKVLVCAPSNAASDTILERVLDVRPVGMKDSDILRVMATGRSPSIVPDSVKPFCLTDDTGFYHVHPSRDAVVTKKLVVATCSGSGVLTSHGLQGHFDYVIVDEACHADEPEILIPLSLANEQTSVVLAGDHKQLGPIVHSSNAREHGLHISLPERLMAIKEYKSLEHPYLSAMLVRNYRSHPDIISIPSAEFYDNKLKPMLADDQSVLDLVPWVNRKCAISSVACVSSVLWHGVVGRDEQETSSPSWFNLSEIVTVSNYVTDLLNDPAIHPRVQASDIVIISPYNKQVKKIRTFLAKHHPNVAEDIRVGSVEMLQGQESRVVILSCVRSSHDFVQADLGGYIGFLSNPKRFNVAVTRAKSLLIVVGNAYVLNCDPMWAKLYQQCLKKGAAIGQLPHVPKTTPAPPAPATEDSGDGWISVPRGRIKKVRREVGAAADIPRVGTISLVRDSNIEEEEEEEEEYEEETASESDEVDVMDELIEMFAKLYNDDSSAESHSRSNSPGVSTEEDFELIDEDY